MWAKNEAVAKRWLLKATIKNNNNSIIKNFNVMLNKNEF